MKQGKVNVRRETLVSLWEKTELFTTDLLHAEPRASFSSGKAGGH